MIDRYAVFGNPIAHSKSPRIHTQFAAQTGEHLQYDKQLIELDKFASSVRDFFATGGKGLNITVPFKQQAWELAEVRTERAQLAGAVNTLWHNAHAELCGDNTDGAGLVSDITERLGWPLRDQHILLLGAGGAARGVLLPLLKAAPASVTIANRTPEKAHELRALFAAQGPINACAFEELEGRRFHLIINATSASLSGELPPLPVSIVQAHTCAYDMVYGAAPTAFLRWCQQQGAAQLSDGLGMLVGQAAESFFIWRGKRVHVEAVLAALRES